ncbi:epoxide hydrolase [Ktedonosporobacter rubrisoli]|uniref:Epoxide hydrolase n=1 Tax=Ktedonosporobacter rubrisoli TaxID=2509675 RepID=A0A4P6JN13_KTERU|nr:epoxide hydrolase family protein [Ktedonosporobacter rubrisoli]QBD76669.1 epoxide hydrolase [Ktedonosporobacter rubrisoli]
MNIQPFKIAFPQTELDDFMARLKNTRWPDEEESAGWSMGTSLSYMRELVDYWQKTYDWRAQETKLNAWPQFVTTIDGTSIHFVYIKSPHPHAKPLLLVHGWPDSFYRFHKVLPLLSDAFDIVVPSIPGFGFSQRKTATPMAVADLFAKLMRETLGYQSFVAQGGDIGSYIVKALAVRYPEAVEAIHLTDVGYPTGREDISSLSAAEQQFALDTQRWGMSEGAYLQMQSTRPQTIAYSLTDSPVGLAAWIISMIKSQADGERVEEAFGGRDELLTNIMIHWLTRTASSSVRMYVLIAWSLYANEENQELEAKSEVPAGISLFPRELQFPQEWAERTLNVVRYEKMPRGGHFAALEEPELFANALLTFFIKKDE